MYFFCLEALQNVQKYAAASFASVSIKEAANRLLVEVRDDGRGFDPDRTTRGAGLQNMEDRFDVLGGQLDIDSAPGKGTRLSGWLPLNA